MTTSGEAAGVARTTGDMANAQVAQASRVALFGQFAKAHLRNRAQRGQRALLRSASLMGVRGLGASGS